MAAESPFPGERANAFAAATRLAARHGLTIDEAAAGDEAPADRDRAAATQRQSSTMSETMGARRWSGPYMP